jgi:hypothetical protein
MLMRAKYSFAEVSFELYVVRCTLSRIYLGSLPKRGCLKVTKLPNTQGIDLSDFEGFGVKRDA